MVKVTEHHDSPSSSLFPLFLLSISLLFHRLSLRLLSSPPHIPNAIFSYPFLFSLFPTIFSPLTYIPTPSCTLPPPTLPSSPLLFSPHHYLHLPYPALFSPLLSPPLLVPPTPLLHVVSSFPPELILPSFSSHISSSPICLHMREIEDWRREGKEGEDGRKRGARRDVDECDA